MHAEKRCIKSKGNSIAFDEAAEALGAEVMRYIYAETEDRATQL